MMTAAVMEDGSAAYNGAVIRQADGSYKIVVSPLEQAEDGWTTDVEGMSLGGVPFLRASSPCRLRPDTLVCRILYRNFSIFLNDVRNFVI